MDTDTTAARKALHRLDAEPLTVKGVVVYRKSDVIRTIRNAIAEPLDAYSVYSVLQAEGVISTDRYTTRANADGKRIAFKIVRVSN